LYLLDCHAQDVELAGDFGGIKVALIAERLNAPLDVVADV
jgi:hypothetical protein